MSHTLIPRNEVEDLCEAELQSKFSALMNDLVRTQTMECQRLMALASLETVSAELARKRALKSRFPTPRC
jgi:BMFP domain-containing protein YqiC